MDNNALPADTVALACQPKEAKAFIYHFCAIQWSMHCSCAARMRSCSCRADLEKSKLAIEELFGKINEIRHKAEQSEVMVQEICRDIKKLDYAKKHLTHTITALRRLAMLISAVGETQGVSEEEGLANWSCARLRCDGKPTTRHAAASVLLPGCPMAAHIAEHPCGNQRPLPCVPE